MILNILGILILLALIMLFAWLARRAWGARQAAVKWPAAILSGLLALVFALVTVVALIGLYRLNAPQNHPVANVKVPATPDQVALGQRFANGCAGCHSSTGGLPLDGSKGNMIEGGPPVGSLWAPNLTPGGPLKGWSDGEIIRAIREGVDKDNRPLVLMPTEPFHNLADAHVQAIVAYLRSQPAVQRDVPPPDFNLLAALFFGAGLFPTSVQPPITEPIVAPPSGPTAEYGQYLVSVSGCRDCHGPDLKGGKPGGFAPVGPAIAGIGSRWSQADFVKTIRTGVEPSGRTLSDEMPWKDFAKMFTDDELKAIHAYLR